MLDYYENMLGSIFYVVLYKNMFLITLPNETRIEIEDVFSVMWMKQFYIFSFHSFMLMLFS
jgi:hypothetical protein